MNKKGLIDSIIANVAILIPVLIVIILFVIASFVIAGLRGFGGSSPSGGSNGISSSAFLLNTINLDGKNVLISEQMMKDRIDANKLVVPLLAYKDIPLINSLKTFMTNDLVFKDKSSCLYLAAGEPKICIQLTKSNNVVTQNSCKSDSQYISYSDTIPVSLNGNDIILYSYYGDCLEAIK